MERPSALPVAQQRYSSEGRQEPWQKRRAVEDRHTAEPRDKASVEHVESWEEGSGGRGGEGPGSGAEEC